MVVSQEGWLLVGWLFGVWLFGMWQIGGMKVCIFDVVEDLFIEYGFEVMLMCQIILCVVVNFVVVNYYFGSKEVLIYVMLLCWFDQLNQECFGIFDCFDVQFGIYIICEYVFGVMFILVLKVLCDFECGGFGFFWLIGCVYIDFLLFVCNFLIVYYVSVVGCFFDVFQCVLLYLLCIEFGWWLYFVIGVLFGVFVGVEIESLIDEFL